MWSNGKQGLELPQSRCERERVRGRGRRGELGGRGGERSVASSAKGGGEFLGHQCAPWILLCSPECAGSDANTRSSKLSASVHHSLLLTFHLPRTVRFAILLLLNQRERSCSTLRLSTYCKNKLRLIKTSQLPRLYAFCYYLLFPRKPLVQNPCFFSCFSSMLFTYVHCTTELFF